MSAAARLWQCLPRKHLPLSMMQRLRDRWLADPAFIIRKATPGKSLRITWVDGKTTLEVMLYPKGTGKTQVTATAQQTTERQGGGTDEGVLGGTARTVPAVRGGMKDDNASPQRKQGAAGIPCLRCGLQARGV